MEYESWTRALGDWFLNAAVNQPVYLSATDAELILLNEKMGLGLVNPAVDLQEALRRMNFRYLKRKYDEWKKAGSKGYPPSLPFLAASVLVVDRQTERGSTAFYSPYSQFIGLPSTISQTEYQQSVRLWWVELHHWLKESKGGSRGESTWMDEVALAGHHSVIGHAYTQVLLRREDRRSLERFLEDVSGEGIEGLIVEDRQLAADHVVESLRRWARGRGSLTGRLRALIEGDDGQQVEVLGNLLLTELIRERIPGGTQKRRVVDLVPIYDEFDRELFLGVVAPNWVSRSEPLTIKGCGDPVEEPGWEYRFDLELTGALLTGGWRTDRQHDVDVALEGAGVHVLVEGMGSWRGTRRIEKDADVYVLAASVEGVHLGFGEPVARHVDGLPEGWSLYGPKRFTDDLGSRCGTTSTQRQSPLLPSFRGGLRLDQRRNYLHGGEPVMELPGVVGQVQVDGRPQEVVEGELDLSQLGLGSGEHTIVAGPFRHQMHSVVIKQPPSNEITLGRDPAGRVVRAGGAHRSIVAGACFPPEFENKRTDVRLSPLTERLLLFGVPGEVAEVVPQREEWANRAGLSWHAVEALDLSTYPGMDRIIGKPEWIAWESDDGWVLSRWGWGIEREPFREPEEWTKAVQQIGISPRIHRFADQTASTSELVEAWSVYMAAGDQT